jgi:hypothetical protein
VERHANCRRQGGAVGTELIKTVVNVGFVIQWGYDNHEGGLSGENDD